MKIDGQAGARDWENWHTWDADRIHGMVSQELAYTPRSSPRAILAAHLVRLGSSLLDVGCGPGALWPRLRSYRQQLNWMGVDVTGEMLSIARREFPDVPLFRADAALLPFADASFDVILLRHVIEHLPLDVKDAAMAEAMRVARKAVVVDFHLPPRPSGPRESRRIPGNFIETHWTAEDISRPAAALDWRLRERFGLRQHESGNNEVWVFEPSAGPVDYSPGPKVSIVMPTYRRPHTLLRTIGTVRAQRYTNWELLIIDNSGDGGYGFGDPRIQTHVLTERASASYARNAALPHATGDLICFFDDDDDMFPDYLEKIVDAFQAHPQVQMVRCGMHLPGGRENFSYATPECCIRREFATPTWESCGCHDQVYFKGIAERNGWTLENDAIIMIREVLCRANKERVGGLREGKL